MKRSHTVLVAVAVTIAITLVTAQTTPDTPIKIGFMVPLSGGSAQNGRDILNGKLPAFRHPPMIGGRS